MRYIDHESTEINVKNSHCDFVQTPIVLRSDDDINEK